MQIPGIVAEKDFQTSKVLRSGSRYFVAVVKKNDQKPVLFKSLITGVATEQDNFWARNLRREIRFLEWFTTAGRRVRTPKVVEFELDPIPWYTREFIEGELQSHKGSDFLFVDTFFKENAHDFADFIIQLQQCTPDLPDAIRVLLTEFDSNLHSDSFLHHLDLISTNAATFFASELVRQMKDYYRQNREMHMLSPVFLAHAEPYASNMVKDNDGFVLIDWERMDLLDVAHDAAILWIRAFEHHQWQRAFLKRFSSQVEDVARFWRLFRFHIVVQQPGNIVHFLSEANKPEQEKRDIFLAFAKQSIEAVLQDKPFL